MRKLRQKRLRKPERLIPGNLDNDIIYQVLVDIIMSSPLLRVTYQNKWRREREQANEVKR